MGFPFFLVDFIFFFSVFLSLLRNKRTATMDIYAQISFGRIVDWVAVKVKGFRLDERVWLLFENFDFLRTKRDYFFLQPISELTPKLGGVAEFYEEKEDVRVIFQTEGHARTSSDQPLIGEFLFEHHYDKSNHQNVIDCYRKLSEAAPRQEFICWTRDFFSGTQIYISMQLKLLGRSREGRKLVAWCFLTRRRSKGRKNDWRKVKRN